MKDVIKVLQGKSDLLSGNGSPEKLIREAEEILGLRFSSDYRAYLMHYGIVAFDGHELTGICSSKRLDVSQVTLNQRKRSTFDLSPLMNVKR